jgi:hypothetical protein
MNAGEGKMVEVMRKSRGKETVKSSRHCKPAPVIAGASEAIQVL